MNVSHESSHFFSFILESFKSLPFIFPRGVMPSIPPSCHYNMYSPPSQLHHYRFMSHFIPFFFLPFLPLFYVSLYFYPVSTSITEPSMYIFWKRTDTFLM